MLSNSYDPKPRTVLETSLIAGSTPSFAILAGRELFFSAGLLGFPQAKRYRLAGFDPGDGSDSPFLMLNSLEQELSFPVIHPDYVSKDYAIPVFPELLGSLEAKSEQDLAPLLIVTMRERVEEVTVNLQGPLLINVISGLAMQLVLEEYPVRHPLLLTPRR